MTDTNKNQETMLVDTNKQKIVRGITGLVNITNKSSEQIAIPSKPAVSEPHVACDKENPSTLVDSKYIIPDIVTSTPASVRKAALPLPQREHMEQQMDVLQGRLRAIKRDSIRPSINGMQSKHILPLSSASVPPSQSAIDAQADTATTNIGGLAAKLESLKRETVRPSFAASAPQQIQFEAAGQYDAHALSRLAQQLFGDKEFCALIERGMNAQLTRSKDGGNDDTKLKELAAMVKSLRRAMKEIQQRTQMFIDHSVRYEKEAAQQVEGVKLASESAAMAAQAELANARREAASAAANYKTALANWQGELDLHKSEAATLRRELERVESERDRAREEARRAEATKASLETEVKEARKSQAQRERELQVDKNSTAQAFYEAKEMFERQKISFEEALAATTTRAEEAETAVEALKNRLIDIESTVARLEGELTAMTACRNELAADKEKLTLELSALREQLDTHLKTHERVVHDSETVSTELADWKKKASDLGAELDKVRSDAVQAAKAAYEAAEAAKADKAAWEVSKASMEATATERAAREQALVEERDKLKSELEAVSRQRGQAEAAASGANERMQQLEQEISRLTAERSSLSAEANKLREDAEAAQRKADVGQETLARVTKEAEETAAKLAHLEGELEALQECTMGLQVGDQKELLSRMVSKIATLEAAVVAAEARRREAHNQLVELKGNIRVFCRIRPHPRPIAIPASDGSSVRVLVDNKEHTFAFDRVFKPQTSQAAIFDEVADVVQSALDGYKVCLFSYGQTGAGKTHTMQGGRGIGEEGIIPRSISKILGTVARLREQGWSYSLEASYIEVYNEQLRDLLGGGRITEANAIQHQPHGGHTIILGATRAEIASEEAAEELIRRAAAARAVESTAMNAVSSRSHAVFMLYITGQHEATGTLLQGSLNLVDLAGSERLARSQAEGQRAREACSINKSLSSLGDVFAALAAKQVHIPYRNSKLTHLLQPCLGGSGKTLMFVNINPEPESAGESLCSLRFAAKVNTCETAAKGGATRNVASIAHHHAGGDDKLFKTSTDGLDARPSLTGRASVMPTSSSAAAVYAAPPPSSYSRRMSMIPSASGGGLGSKRGPLGPPAPITSKVARPKYN